MAAGVRETFRGSPWPKNCREWVYFDVVLDSDAIAACLSFPQCVTVHENLDPRTGTKRGFFCEERHNAVMGRWDGPPIHR